MSTKNEVPTIKVKGVLSSYEYSVGNFGKPEDKPAHRIGVKFADGERDRLKAECDRLKIYEGTSFIPAWYKPRVNHPTDVEYINVKSIYSIPAYYRQGSDVVESSIEDMTSDFGSLRGSEVTVTLTLKPGAVYPAAIAFRKLVTRSFEDFFDEDDLPFN